MNRHIIIVGGGTSGAVLAARLSEDANLQVTLLEAGPDHDAYTDRMRIPSHASDSWAGEVEHVATTYMKTADSGINMIQGRILGGTSAFNGLATLRGQPSDYDAWAAAGLDGWSWHDVKSTFIAAENDVDFGSSDIHGDSGPLPVRRWRQDELSRSQSAFLEGMIDLGEPFADDINDPDQLPGIGIFPVTVDAKLRRISTSLAYLTEAVRERDNLNIRTSVEVESIRIAKHRAEGVLLKTGEVIAADEVVITAGAIGTAAMLLRSGIGPCEHLHERNIDVQADLPVGETMSDHLGAGILYRHPGPRGGNSGPAQVVMVGASNGKDADYHLMPISLQDPLRNPLTYHEKRKLLSRPGESRSPGLRTLFNIARFLATPTSDETLSMVAVFLLRSTGKGGVQLAEDLSPSVTAPPLPDNAEQILRPAFDQMAAWENTKAFRDLGIKPLFPADLTAPDAISEALARNTISYGHMVGTCPMGTVLDSDCRVLGIDSLRIADASVMPTIPCGNTYLGCVMVAERIAQKMKGANQ